MGLLCSMSRSWQWCLVSLSTWLILPVPVSPGLRQENDCSCVQLLGCRPTLVWVCICVNLGYMGLSVYVCARLFKKSCAQIPHGFVCASVCVHVYFPIHKR